MSLAHMQDQRQARFMGDSNLTAEHIALHVARRQVVVIVQTHFAERARALVA